MQICRGSALPVHKEGMGWAGSPAHKKQMNWGYSLILTGVLVRNPPGQQSPTPAHLSRQHQPLPGNLGGARGHRAARAGDSVLTCAGLGEILAALSRSRAGMNCKEEQLAQPARAASWGSAAQRGLSSRLQSHQRHHS